MILGLGAGDWGWQELAPGRLRFSGQLSSWMAL